MKTSLPVDISFNELHILSKSRHPTDKTWSIRTSVLHLGSQVGKLCQAFLSAPLDPVSQHVTSDFFRKQSSERDDIVQSMSSILFSLLDLSNKCNLILSDCILKKMELNERKYPVNLCKGKSGKYTSYSNHTGITKTHGQQSNSTDIQNIDSESISLTDITSRIREFSTDRQWSKFHSPRNIVLALMGELGELAEIFQWKGDNKDDSIGDSMNVAELEHVGQELADCAIYLIRVADVCSIDLADGIIQTHGKGI